MKSLRFFDYPLDTKCGPSGGLRFKSCQVVLLTTKQYHVCTHAFARTHAHLFAMHLSPYGSILCEHTFVLQTWVSCLMKAAAVQQQAVDVEMKTAAVQQQAVDVDHVAGVPQPSVHCVCQSASQRSISAFQSCQLTQHSSFLTWG